MKIKLYIGLALTHAPPAFVDKVHRLREVLRAEYEVLDFVGLTADTPEGVYIHDIHVCVATCDAFIALCDYPAIGLGWELGTAVETLRKPVLALAQQGVKITRLVLGAPCVNPKMAFRRYRSFGEIPGLIRSFLEENKL